MAGEHAGKPRLRGRAFIVITGIDVAPALKLAVGHPAEGHVVIQKLGVRG